MCFLEIIVIHWAKTHRLDFLEKRKKKKEKEKERSYLPNKKWFSNNPSMYLTFNPLLT